MNKEIIEKYNDPVERLVTYHALLSGYDSGYVSYSLKKLSDSTGIPLPVIRNDFKMIFENSGGFIDSGDDDIEIPSKFLDGLYDNYDFYSVLPYAENKDSDIISIPVTIDEYVAYQNIFEKNNSQGNATSEESLITSTIRNIKYVNDYDANDLRKLEYIEKAILSTSAIKFNYLVPGEDTSKTVSIIPTKIGFDATENRYVIISTPDNRIDIYELDYIKGNIETISSENLTSHPEYLKSADKVWGFEYDKCITPSGKRAKPLHVKIEFIYEDVHDKIRRSLELRKPDKLEVTKNGKLIYEDDVYGKDSFINWVLSFGSSAKVISPKSLAKEIMDICEREIAKY